MAPRQFVLWHKAGRGSSIFSTNGPQVFLHRRNKKSYMLNLFNEATEETEQTRMDEIREVMVTSGYEKCDSR